MERRLEGELLEGSTDGFLGVLVALIEVSSN